MHTYIKKLQSKEEDSRKQILIVSLVLAMIIVGSIWVYSLTDRFSGDNAVANTTADDSSVKPFALLKDSIASTYENISASVGKFSSSIKPVDQPGQKQVDLIVVDHPTSQ